MTRSLDLSFSREVFNRHTLNAGRAVAVFAALAMGTTAAQAQLFHTFVAAAGDDNATCGSSAPCGTLNGALAKTKVNGEVTCLDQGNFHTATIKKSVSIDCHDAGGSIIRADGVVIISHGIVIDFDSFAATDVRRTVNLRGLNVQGLDGGSDGILITGTPQPALSGKFGATAPGGSVFIENCVINGSSAPMGMEFPIRAPTAASSTFPTPPSGTWVGPASLSFRGRPVGQSTS